MKNADLQTNANAQRVFVRAAEDDKSTCSKRRPRFTRDQLHSMNRGDCPVGATSKEETLSTSRQESSIPIAADSQLPSHQEQPKVNWMYPSEKQFYEAMIRKGWQPDDRDMRNVVKIHNTVNERVWSEITHWEHSLHPNCPCPKLKSFQGKPQIHSPKAQFLNFLGYKLPFDRHDWIVDRCGVDVRYVIDFYDAKSMTNAPIAMHLDVRPALDTLGAFWDRLKMQSSWIGSGRWRHE